MSVCRNQRRFLAILSVAFSVYVLPTLLATARAQNATAQMPGQATAAAVPLEDKSGSIIPIRYDPPIRPFVTLQVQINNSEPLTLEVDTGSPYSLILAPWAQKKLGLAVKGTPQPLGQENLKGTLVTGAHLKFVSQAGSKTMDINMPELMVADLPLFKSHLGSVAGVLGGDYFKVLITRFDFDRKTLTFFPAKRPPIMPPPGATVLPLEIPNDGFQGIVSLSLPVGKAVKCVIDTASDVVLLPNDAVSPLPPLALGAFGTLFSSAGQDDTQYALSSPVL